MTNVASKLDKTIELLKKRELNGLIIYSNGTQSMGHPYLYYFSGFKPFGPNCAIVISRSGDIALLIEPKWNSIYASEKTWINEIIGTSDFQNDLKAIIQKFNISGTIGIIGASEMIERTYSSIEEVAELKLADDIIGEIAREKTKEEKRNIRELAKIADIGFRTFLKYAHVGIREYELTAEIDFSMRTAGAEDNFVLLSSSKHNYAIHSPVDKKLTKGDIVIAEITPGHNGQSIQLCRTAFMGEPSTALIEKYKLLTHSFEESLNGIKAGAPAFLISRAINKVISEAGYAEYCYPPYMRARGHGCGIGSIVGPVELGPLDDQNEVKLQNQQVIVVHPNQYFPETGYLACGETILVTETGRERLTETEMKLYVQEV